MPVFTIHPDRVTEDFVRDLRRRAVMALALLLGIITISTISLMILDRHPDLSLYDRFLNALWDTLNLISTVGSLTEDLSSGQRVWAILVIALGLGAALYAFGTLQSLMHAGDVRRLYVRRKMQLALNSLENHFIICGYGVVGRRVAKEISKGGHPLVVIDQDDEAVSTADEEGYLTIRADCTRENTLRQAGVERAAGLIASLGADASNVFLILIARELKANLRIVTRADRDETRNTLRRAGASRVIVPSEIAGLQLSHLILRPHVSEFIASAIGEGEYEFAEFVISPEHGMAGKTLRDLNLPRRLGMIVISIIDVAGHHEFNPSADRVLQEDDTLIIVCQEGGMEYIESMD